MLLPRSIHRDYDRLAGFLRRISLRFQLLATLESVLRLATGFILVILGSIFVLQWGETFPYLSFSYSLIGLFSLIVLFSLGLWRIVSRPSTERVARGLEVHFPRLRDDVTNSLLLFREVTRKGPGQISGGFIAAQMQKTADEVCSIRPQELVSLRKAFRHLRLLIPLLSALAAILAIDPSFWNRSLALISHPWAILPSRETSIAVDPPGATVLRGTPVVIEARAEGNVPPKLMLRIWPEGRKEARLSMESEGEGRFSYRIPSAQTSFQYQAYHGPSASPVYPLRVVDPPDVGRIRLTLIPPDYTGLPKEVREEGHIEALKGTVANLEAQTTKAVSRARIILDRGNQLPLEVREDRLRGTLLIFYPGAYSIRVQDELGFENPDPVQYQIRLIPDEYPEGEILTPAQDLEVSGNEILPLVYRAQDDFGVSAVRLSYQAGGRERSIKLKSPKNARSVGPEVFQWDLASLSLIGGDRVRCRLEVEDNDSVSGPKVGYSRSFYLFIKDERTEAAREGEEAQRIAEALLDLLGDHLEARKDQEALARKMGEILKGVDRNLERLGNRVERFDLESLRRNLASLKERLPGEQGETVTRELERLALLAEDIAKKARMKEVETLAREIQNRQRRLLESLQDLKGSLTDKNLEALLKELDKLESLIQSVMEALSKLASRLPDEFINSPDLRGMQFQDLFQDLGEIRHRLRAGDLQGALEAAQRLLQSLSEMMAALGRAGAQAGMDSLNRLQGEMARQSGELDKILAEQMELLNQTEGIDREVRQKGEKTVDRRMQESLSRLKELLQNLRGSLAPEQQDSVEELEKLLQKESLEGFSGLLRELEKDLRGKAGDRKAVGELKKTLENLFPSPQELLTPDHKKKFPDLTAHQHHLKERTRALQEKLEMLAQLFPGMDSEILKTLQGATGSMGKAAARLGAEDAPGAIPPEQDAVRSLSKSRQGMQKMAQQMASQMQAARWGYNLVYDPRPGWYYGPWVPMPTLPQPEVKRPRERGYTGIDREEFNPPSKDAYRVPRIYREKVLEGLKEEAPAPYKKKVERYFKGLTE